MFDSSHTRGQPRRCSRSNRSLAGWRECVQLMTVGETRRCWVPQKLAYRGQAGRPTGTVVFDIELLETRANPTIPPPDVKEPPADAMKTATGLAYKVLRPGTGTRKPTAQERVTVHYTGWTTDGKMFDSSVSRGTPTTFRLDGVIAGWTEGVALMVEGERTRFWIPQDLAYKGEGRRPARHARLRHRADSNRTLDPRRAAESGDSEALRLPEAFISPRLRVASERVRCVTPRHVRIL